MKNIIFLLLLLSSLAHAGELAKQNRPVLDKNKANIENMKKSLKSEQIKSFTKLTFKGMKTAIDAWLKIKKDLSDMGEGQPYVMDKEDQDLYNEISNLAQ